MTTHKKRLAATFEEYLSDIFISDYMGTDDDLGDNFNDFVSDLSAQEMFDYAEDFVVILKKQYE